MKKMVFTGLFALSFFFAMSQSLLPAEQAIARKQQKLILLNFSGSDWCIPCINMQKKYFENSVFLKMADSQLVIVRADFPRKKKNLPAKDIVQRNEALADRFNPNGSFPLTLLLDADLKILKKWDGLPVAGVEEFIQSISTFFKQPSR